MPRQAGTNLLRKLETAALRALSDTQHMLYYIYIYVCLCVCVCVCVCVYVYIHTYIHKYTHTYIHICINVFDVDAPPVDGFNAPDSWGYWSERANLLGTTLDTGGSSASPAGKLRIIKIKAKMSERVQLLVRDGGSPSTEIYMWAGFRECLFQGK